MSPFLSIVWFRFEFGLILQTPICSFCIG